MAGQEVAVAATRSFGDHMGAPKEHIATAEM